VKEGGTLLIRFWGFLLVVLLGCAGPATGAEPEPAEDSEKAPDALPRARHEVQRRVRRAAQAVADQRYNDAAADLQALLSEDLEDCFLEPVENEATQTTVRREAWRLLDAMPPAGRQWYELQFGARAKTLLDEAVRAADRRSLAVVASRYFHTQAGYEATLLLARDEFDQGRFAEAIGWLRRIVELRAVPPACEPECSLLLATCWVSLGRPEHAEEALRRLGRRMPGAKIRIGPREFAVSAENTSALEWLASVAAPQPNLREKPPDWHGALGELRWVARTLDDPADVEAAKTHAKSAIEENGDAILAVQPLVVGDTVLARTPWRLVGIDFGSGRRLWEFPWHDGDEHDTHQSGPGGRPVPMPNRGEQLRQRLWQDEAYGRIASDGRRVFLLDRLDFPLSGPIGPMIVRGNAVFRIGRLAGSGVERPNRLVALDLDREGATVWAVGGETGEDEPALAGAFFLGPPLVDRQRLYVLAEIKGEILLCTLDASRGRLEWSQVIARPPATVAQEPLRRLAGLVPSLADGVLVCPTSTGAVAGVELATRSLLWGFQYHRSESSLPPRLPLRIARLPNLPELENRSADAGATIADGRVLVTPIDSDELYCLDLLTGEELWSVARGDTRFVAGVHQGRILLAGPSSVTCLRLADRRPAWTPASIRLPQDAKLSGRGLWAGRCYHLPTSARQLVTIDVEAGRITATRATDAVLGNLIAAGGALLSQSPDELSCFDPPR